MEFFIGLLVGLGTGSAFWIWAGAAYVSDFVQKAIAAKVGRWVIDPKSGKREFVFGKE